MTLTFPNPSRNFDASNNVVTFWGYDKAMEVVFSLDTAALKKLSPDVGDAEAALLKAFDAATKHIHEVAERVYARRNRRSYACRLLAEDF